MPYAWDEAKRRSNIEKHGIDFRAIAAFEWGSSLSEESIRLGERRIFTLGYIGARLHAVTHVKRGGNIRIISLRKAHRTEERRYAAAQA